MRPPPLPRPAKPWAFLAAAGIAASLAAADRALGVQVHAVRPLGVLGDGAHLDRRPGTGLGLGLPLDFGPGRVLRPRVDYLAFRRERAGVIHQADSLLLMVDYDHHLRPAAHGVYLVAGVGLHSTRRKVERPAGAGRTKADAGTTGLAYGFGAGFPLGRRGALEVRWLAMDMDALPFRGPGMPEPRFQAEALMASLLWKF
jgi:hypothetical protein